MFLDFLRNLFRACHDFLALFGVNVRWHANMNETLVQPCSDNIISTTVCLCCLGRLFGFRRSVDAVAARGAGKTARRPRPWHRRYGRTPLHRSESRARSPRTTARRRGSRSATRANSHAGSIMIPALHDRRDSAATRLKFAARLDVCGPSDAALTVTGLKPFHPLPIPLQRIAGFPAQLTPSFFCKLDDDVVY